MDGGPHDGMPEVRRPLDTGPQCGCRDGALVRAAVRGVREQLGLELGACAAWTRLADVHYTRPPAHTGEPMEKVPPACPLRQAVRPLISAFRLVSYIYHTLLSEVEQ